MIEYEELQKRVQAFVTSLEGSDEIVTDFVLIMAIKDIEAFEEGHTSYGVCWPPNIPHHVALGLLQTALDKVKYDALPETP